MAHEHKAADETSTPDSASAEEGGVDTEGLRQEIRLRAYYRYCERGCGPGCELDDWVAAEREVLAVYAAPAPSATKAPADDRHGRRRGRARR
jgi:hypothetical protein